MKLIGFSATYSPNVDKNTNKHNYFMNGIIKEVISENCCVDVCEIANMRNLFAVADGSKSERQGGNAAFLCMDIMNNVYGADFQTAYKHYFSEANRLVQSRSFHASGAKMHMDIGVIYVYRDWIKAYNFGDVCIFHKSEKGLKKISGDAPKTIERDKVVRKNGELTIKKNVWKNTPYIGNISEDLAVIPYISPQIRLEKNDIAVIATESVVSAIGEAGIIEILDNDNILVEDKVTALIKAAIDKNSQGNYTVILVANKPRKPINKFKVSILAIAAAILVSLFCVFALPKLNDAYNHFVENLIKRMYLIDDRPELMPWIPMTNEVKVEGTKQETEVPIKNETEKADDSSNKATVTNNASQQTTKPATKPNAAKPTDVPTDKPSDSTDKNVVVETESPKESAVVETEPPLVQEPPIEVETPAESDVSEPPTPQIIPGIQTTIDESINDIINGW